MLVNLHCIPLTRYRLIFNCSSSVCQASNSLSMPSEIMLPSMNGSPWIPSVYSGVLSFVCHLQISISVCI